MLSERMSSAREAEARPGTSDNADAVAASDAAAGGGGGDGVRQKGVTSMDTTDDNINVFRVPHSRMKDLVEERLRKVDKIKEFSKGDRAALDTLLQAVYEAMWEMKSHEYIENHYIMDKLKARLQQNKIYNQLVCNCHEDSKLLDVIRLVEKVYYAQSEEQQEDAGHQLQHALTDFLDEFLHHMEEEEKVFTPLLNQNFEPRELVNMNEVVLKQHSLFREKVRTEKSLLAVKRKRDEDVFDEFEFSIEDLRFRKSYCQEVSDRLQSDTEEAATTTTSPTTATTTPAAAAATSSQPDQLVKKRKLSPQPQPTKNESEDGSSPDVTSTSGAAEGPASSAIPEEIVAKIAQLLESPRDLTNAAGVCRLWRRACLSPVHWRRLLPTQWSRGQWSFQEVTPAAAMANLDDASSTAVFSADDEVSAGTNQAESRVFNGLLKGMLPQVGSGVQELVLSFSPGLTNTHVREFIRLCPNITKLDLSHTRIDERAFALSDEVENKSDEPGQPLRRLQELILDGCLRVTDELLDNLRRCFLVKGRRGRKSAAKKRKVFAKSNIRRISLSGCVEVTSYGLEMMMVHQSSLVELDLSGCYKLDGETLTLFAEGCPGLRPAALNYCNDIEDGPFPADAGGCLNLECGERACCQKMRN